MDFQPERTRPVRIGGAFDLDMSKVVEQTVQQTVQQVLGQMGRVIAEQTMPALAQLLEAVKQARVVLDPIQTQAVLHSVLPEGYLWYGDGSKVQLSHLAQELNEALMRAGYGLVPTTPEAAASTGSTQAPLPTPPWHDMRTPEERADEYQRGERHPSVDRLDSGVARADTRLAEENASGVYGAWHEPDQ